MTHTSPIVYCDPGLTNASMRYVYMKIDGDLACNQQPVAIPDDGEIITVHRVPVKKLLDEVEAFRDRGFEIDARLYGLALGLQFGDVKQFKAPYGVQAQGGGWGWTLAMAALGFLAYRYAFVGAHR